MSFCVRRLAASIFAVTAIVAASAGPASADRAAGVTADNVLVLFDTTTPGTVNARPITGLQATDEVALGLDLRPGTGELFLITAKDGATGMSSVTRTYSVDPTTAAATFVGVIQNPPSPPAGAGDNPSGFDFQPLVDRIRVVNSVAENLRINPATGGLAADDTNLTFTDGATGPVTGLAYDRNVAPGPPGTLAPPGSATTLYGIDVGSDMLVVQGGLNGADPGGPNGGVVKPIGPLGVTMTVGVNAGFDISPTGTAYAVLAVNSVAPRSLYTVNLQTGAATEIGSMPWPLISLTVFPPDPPDNCPGVSGDNQSDVDGDGLGDACDDDIDGDGLTNAGEAARGSDPARADTDGDGKSDAVDACPLVGSAAIDGCPVALADVVAPKVALAGVPSRMTYKNFLKGVKVKLTPNEAASFEVSLLGRTTTSRLARVGDVALAEKTLRLATGARSTRLKPKRGLLGKRRRFTVRLRIVATDAAKNHRSITKTIRVR